MRQQVLFGGEETTQLHSKYIWQNSEEIDSYSPGALHCCNQNDTQHPIHSRGIFFPVGIHCATMRRKGGGERGEAPLPAQTSPSISLPFYFFLSLHREDEPCLPTAWAAVLWPGLALCPLYTGTRRANNLVTLAGSRVAHALAVLELVISSLQRKKMVPFEEWNWEKKVRKRKKEWERGKRKR